ncbi:site-specific DNA-methyltransferase [uncultured Thiodictyon sp.]|jgi:adenine-specific DNA-methyltransferase|uniref:site-specific DNA-methyltransferase n=1 Tax=uncultured Thiodictyon sp. TaxID=1846217 RepID=UPI0025E8F04B|nr:site-specific DNA-methyltransferase [uncultured Thiodictyon sp.]
MADKYDQYTKDELLRLLRERDRRPRFGLTWERDLIDHDRSVNGDFVALDLVPELSQGLPPFGDLIIEGDNFDALRALRMSHAGRVKCIYIDPPYNTGNRDFIYNDRFIDREDSYRHSKWLEFMYRRLELARELLAEDGLIFVSIDDNEAFHLGLLMEQLFGADNFIACFVWRKVDSPNDNKVPITPDHEFILCYASSKSAVKLAPMTAPGILDAYPRVDEGERRYRDRLLKKNGKNSLRRDRPTMFFPMMDPDGNDVYPIHDNGEEARWAMGKAGVEKHRAAGTLIWKRRPKHGGTGWEPYTREFAPDEPTRPFPTIWSDLATMRQAKAMLRDIFATSDLFSTPKPVELIARILALIHDPHAVVLDFFAGSGTTAQAVLKLNAEDGGQRRFILVSNTEATADEPDKNLCRDICAERVRRVMTGYVNRKGEPVPGLGGGFAYLRTRRIPAETLFRAVQHAQVWTALQLIHGDLLTPFDPGLEVQVLVSGEAKVIYLPRVSETAVAAVRNALAGTAQVVVYSWQAPLLAQRIADARVSFEPIPESLVSRFGTGTGR